MADNALTRLPLAGQLGVAILVALLICGGFYYFYYSGALEEQNQKEKELADLQTQIRALEATANRLPELKRILPPEKEMPDLMRRVQYLAAQSSLAIRDFTPAAVAQREFYMEVPVRLSLDGTYHNLGAFFDRISRMSRLVNIGNVKIAARQQQAINNTISVQAVATTYVYREQPPAPAGGQQAGRRARPRGRR
jgi:type IV pilus assembly protein PilO